MADEIAQVVEMEYKGVYYLFKGTKAVIAAMARFVKALQEWHNEKYLKKPGNCTWDKLLKVSEGTPPILEFPKEMFDAPVIGKDKEGNAIFGKSEFDLYCEKYNLRYCIMPDMNPYDDYIPVAVPTQDMGIHQEQIKAVMSRRIKAEEENNAAYDEKIIAVKEKILNATTEEEKAETEAELMMLEDAKAQNEKLLNESKAKADRDNVLDFTEYLKQGEGTLAEFNPEMALKQENACGIVKEYEPYDCMWPVRDAGLVPESKEIYYSQRTKDDKIHYIRRKFVEDEQGRIFSEYYVRIPGTSSEKVYSDFGLSQVEWEKQLPHLLKEAGLENEQPTAVVQSKERFMKYQEFIEENFKNARKEASGKEKDKTYSSDEAKEFVEKHNENEEIKMAYEDSQFTVIKVDSEKLMYDESDVLCLQTEDGLLRGVMVESMDEKYAEIFIKSDNSYTLLQPDGNKQQITGAGIIAKNGESVVDAAVKAASRKGR